MWVPMLGYLFLSTSQACIFCRLPSRDLSARLAHLCEQISSEWGDCKTSWNFSTFALDEVSMDRITEKTHRVMTVLEIKGYLFSLPTYWQWLQKSKLPEYMRQALCPPACRKQDLREAKILLLFFSAASLILGFISCIIESRSLLAEQHS
ncbi:sperm-egg fusion protein TMEM95 isoform X2 [Antechinus flavipes]|uniref:sperm-egg fusion protein TMEM95 isoform X2 n=1 Tax=Antechinus flavipes TaxID=38775 RepID=UPI0022363C06|nr:sperm-egg fusion protein TMEM95 isoform X2 [Antechinus flavipes]